MACNRQARGLPTRTTCGRENATGGKQGTMRASWVPGKIILGVSVSLQQFGPEDSLLLHQPSWTDAGATSCRGRRGVVGSGSSSMTSPTPSDLALYQATRDHV